jgi:hypothetical protein
MFRLCIQIGKELNTRTKERNETKLKKKWQHIGWLIRDALYLPCPRQPTKNWHRPWCLLGAFLVWSPCCRIHYGTSLFRYAMLCISFFSFLSALLPWSRAIDNCLHHSSTLQVFRVDSCVKLKQSTTVGLSGHFWCQPLFPAHGIMVY